MLIFRDWYLAWACSIGFEICEITFRHWLPNFWECWWDHLFLDLFGCNLIGMILGWWSLEYFASQKLTWLKDDNKSKRKAISTDTSLGDPACKTQLITALEKLRPAVFEKYHWDGLASYQRFFGMVAFCVICLVIDCNNFFMKYVLYVPAEADVLKLRVALWGAAAIATSKEWYDFTSNRFCHRLGPFAWMAFYTSAVESLIVFKCSEGQFTEPFPWYVKVIWTLILLGFCWLLSIVYTNEQRAKE